MPNEEQRIPDIESLRDVRDQKGRLFHDLCREKPLLLVFLRHLGCTFCRVVLDEVSIIQEAIRKLDVNIGFVQMGSWDQARWLFEKYALNDVSVFADQSKELYRIFSIPRGTFGQLFGPSTLMEGVKGLVSGKGIGKMIGDPWQMPGCLLIRDDKIVASHEYANVADKPDYLDFARKALSTSK